MSDTTISISCLKYIPWSENFPEDAFLSVQPANGGFIELPGPKTKVSRGFLRLEDSPGGLVGRYANGQGEPQDKSIDLGIPSPPSLAGLHPEEMGFALEPLAKVLCFDGKTLITDAPGGILLQPKGRSPYFVPLVSAGAAADGKAFISGFQDGTLGLLREGKGWLWIEIPENIQARRIFYAISVTEGEIFVRGDSDLLIFDSDGRHPRRELLDEDSYLEKVVPVMWELKEMLGGDGRVYLSCSGPDGMAIVEVRVN